MAEERLQKARRLIDNGQYQAARELLDKIDDDQAAEMLAELDVLETTRPPLLRVPYLLAMVLGLLIPLVIAAVLFIMSGAGKAPPQTIQASTARPTLSLTPTAPASPTPLPTASPTETPTPSRTTIPTDTQLPPTWTPTDRVTLVPPDTTGTALAQYIQTGEALVHVTGTIAARNAALTTRGTQVLGVIGTPDDACVTEARSWWRTARLTAADTFFNLVDDYDATIMLVLEQPGTYAGLLEAMQVDFLESLREEVAMIGYPPCAFTAREMLLAHMRQRIRAVRSITAGDRPAYDDSVVQAADYRQYFERELGILRVAVQ
ncbi:MAG: hypothetical protein CL610_28660 [Anaerolineaceae bacterium]|nr:hypothetical protein [Anaerolineaceae bacterium]